MQPQDWLSLSEAAQQLGVHPSTVRAWANQGHLPVHRTQGGHRRFRREDVEIWVQAQQKDQPLEIDGAVQNALRRTRFEITEGRLAQESWYAKLNEDAREQYRLSGRSLLFGLMSHLASDGSLTNAEARSLGYEYASRGWGCGLSSVEAVKAFLFFRNLMLESMLGFYENAGVRSPQAWGDITRKIHQFTDLIQITLLETYEAYQRGSTGAK